RGGRLQWGRARASAEIAAEWAVVLNPRRASMGPRSCERGNPVHRRLSVNIILCFNGAALVRARKWADTLTHASLNRILLQWGRARASAEIGRLPVYPGQSP